MQESVGQHWSHTPGPSSFSVTDWHVKEKQHTQKCGVCWERNSYMRSINEPINATTHPDTVHTQSGEEGRDRRVCTGMGKPPFLDCQVTTSSMHPYMYASTLCLRSSGTYRKPHSGNLNPQLTPVHYLLLTPVFCFPCASTCRSSCPLPTNL